MKETYKGLMSGFMYARKGDVVNVIREDAEMTFIQNESTGEKFHVRNERLSNEYVAPDAVIDEELVFTPQKKKGKGNSVQQKTMHLF